MAAAFRLDLLKVCHIKLIFPGEIVFEGRQLTHDNIMSDVIEKPRRMLPANLTVW